MLWPGAAVGSAEVASTSANSARVNSTDQRADTATPPHRPSRMPAPNPPPGRFAAADVGLLGSFISGLVTTLVSPSIAHRQKAVCVVLLERRPPPPCSVAPRPGRCGVGIVLQVTHPPLPQPRTGSRTVFGLDGVTICRSTPTLPSPLPMRSGKMSPTGSAANSPRCAASPGPLATANAGPVRRGTRLGSLRRRRSSKWHQVPSTCG